MTDALTPKQEKFCQKFIQTGNASEAYRQSYDAQKMKPESINRKAKELMDNGKITARVKELQETLVKKHEVTVESIAQELEEARTMALTAQTPQTSAAVAASMGKAKLYGLIIDKAELKATVETLNDDQLDGEIKRLAQASGVAIQ
ncbi:terminase small subunit [Polynucleobacter asymbioticus]|jgi:phage terminase small subunit|uniref:Terminase n=1 Tax=Polynucleobacter asymbioticus TaxID=576611 RepID=A0AAC9IV94_9BURK|nr:terminase small subunit [Polynucleobacter asymbioticus]APB99033.1 terminase [Polynucleobacter asymbioticus]APC01335.1 terminase [Polynucleobacter asymbioticus]